jgi:hypothetical protein
MNPIAEKLLQRLPEIAHVYIMDCAGNECFIKCPDCVDEHEATWHQFGILTHTRKSVEAYDVKAQEYLKQWEIAPKIDVYLSEAIRGMKKADLLAISLALHDIGKFARVLKRDGDELVPEYTGHEAKSERFVKDPFITSMLESYGLKSEQIAYVARCVGLHYELGKVRGEAKESSSKYDKEFARSREFGVICAGILFRYFSYRVEIGLLFLYDSLAKTDIVATGKTDQELVDELEQMKLPPELLGAVKQREVNIAVAEGYLRTVVCEQVLDTVHQSQRALVLPICA